MKNFFFIFILLLALYKNAHSQTIRECEAVTAENITHWGHIANEVEEEKPIKKLYGVVTAGSKREPVYSALVELFSDDGKTRTPSFPSEKRVAACVTQPNGKFRFDAIKPGKYILAVGRPGFNITFVRFTLGSTNRGGSSKGLTVSLEIGT